MIQRESIIFHMDIIGKEILCKLTNEPAGEIY